MVLRYSDSELTRRARGLISFQKLDHPHCSVSTDRAAVAIPTQHQEPHILRVADDRHPLMATQPPLVLLRKLGAQGNATDLSQQLSQRIQETRVQPVPAVPRPVSSS